MRPANVRGGGDRRGQGALDERMGTMVVSNLILGLSGEVFFAILVFYEPCWAVKAGPRAADGTNG